MAKHALPHCMASLCLIQGKDFMIFNIYFLEMQEVFCFKDLTSSVNAFFLEDILFLGFHILYEVPHSP